MPRLPRWLRVAFAWTILVLGVTFMVGAVLVLAGSGRMDKGVSIDGVPVGGMTLAQARQAISEKVKPLEGDLQVTVGDKKYTIALDSIRFRLDVDGMVQEAFEAGKRSPAVLRVARRLLGVGVHRDVPVKYACSDVRLQGIVRTMAVNANKRPTSASISISSGEPEIQPSKKGLRLKIDETVALIKQALARPEREVVAPIHTLKPNLTEADIGKIVVIHQKQFRLFLYDREEEVNSFEIAVGMPQYPTPNGRFHITWKEKNPTWLPTSEWAKDKQGVPQPPGPDNPLGGFWMDIGGGIGIHATPFPKSLGEQASHGCIRMASEDAETLFNEVKVGTPVFITD